MIGNLLICLHLVILLNHTDVILLKIKMIKFGELYLHLLREVQRNIEFNLEEMTSSTFFLIIKLILVLLKFIQILYQIII